MSNYNDWNNYREPERRRGNGWKILALFMALILLAAAVIGVFGSRKDGKWFAESDIAKFFNSWGKGNKTPGGEHEHIYENGVCTICGETEGTTAQGLRIAFNVPEIVMAAEPAAAAPATLSAGEVEPHADASEKVYTLTAIVLNVNNEPAEDKYQGVRFAMNWVKDGASGTPSDFVEMTVAGNTATFKCIQAFNTQIIITCTAEINSEIKNTRTLDYAKKFFGIADPFNAEKEVDLIDEPDGQGVDNCCLYTFIVSNVGASKGTRVYFLDDGSSIQFSDIGSLSDEIINCTVTFTPTEELKAAVLEAGKTFNGTPSFSGYSCEMVTNSLSVDLQDLAIYGVIGSAAIKANSSWLGTAYVKAVNSCACDFRITFNFNFKYGGAQTYVYYANISAAANGLDFNDNNEGFVF